MSCAASSRDKPLNLLSEPATADRWTDLETVFGERGACGGCWCMHWRLGRKDWEAGKGPKNKQALKIIVDAGEMPGIIGYVDGEPMAWCAVAPRAAYPVLDRSRVLKPVDDEPVWSVSCLFVSKAYRRSGVSVRMLEEAVKFAGNCGATIVEGYPIEPTMHRTPDAFIWLGTPSAFLKAGFEEVTRRSKSRPIMRFDLRQ